MVGCGGLAGCLFCAMFLAAFPLQRVQAQTFEQNFKQNLEHRLSQRGLSLKKLESNRILAVTLIDLNNPGRAGLSTINGDETLCSASMGKWSCAVAAAELIKTGKIQISESWDGTSSGSTLTQGDLHAMMQASSNFAANRICTIVNSVGSPGFGKGQTRCFSNELMERLGINLGGQGIINGNLFNKGRPPRCLKDQELIQVPRKTTNVGTSNSFARLVNFVDREESYGEYSWLKFNPAHEGRPDDDVRSPAFNRFASSFGCLSPTSECPIKRRKTGSLTETQDYDRCNNDSVLVDDGAKKFILVLLCNEPYLNYCRQEIFDDVAAAAKETVSIYPVVKHGAGNEKGETKSEL